MDNLCSLLCQGSLEEFKKKKKEGGADFSKY